MTIGIDLGATKIATGLVDEKGKVLKKVKIATEAEKGVEKVSENVVFSIKQVATEKIDRIGLAVAGQIDIKKGIIIYSPNLKWKKVALVKLVSQKIRQDLGWEDFKISIDNDANCFALAEAIYGAAKGKKYVVGLTLGTGIGSGLVIDGKIYHGQAFATEMGHMVVKAGGRLCSCGRKGHLEAYASGGAIERRYKELTGRKKIATDIEIEALQNKDSEAFQIYREAGKYLGVGLANIVNMLDPEIIVLGGGLARSDLLIDLAKEELKKEIFFRDKATEIVRSKLGDEAGIVGAACIVK